MRWKDTINHVSYKKICSACATSVFVRANEVWKVRSFILVVKYYSFLELNHSRKREMNILWLDIRGLQSKIRGQTIICFNIWSWLADYVSILTPPECHSMLVFRYPNGHTTHNLYNESIGRIILWKKLRRVRDTTSHECEYVGIIGSNPFGPQGCTNPIRT